MQDAMWYYVQNDLQCGPISQDELKELLRSGAIVSATQVWTEGMDDWETISGLPGFQTVENVSGYPPPLKPSQSATVSYAGFWKRAVALLIDTIVGVAGGALGGGILGGIIGAVMGASGHDIASITMVAGWMGQIWGLLFGWLYCTLLESSQHQATLGKMALGIKVTDMDGNRIGFGRANGRYWGKWLSTFTLLVGYFMAAFTSKKQALHDIVAGCLVVNK